MMRLLLVPDRYAHYRKGIFEGLTRYYDVTLFASYYVDKSLIRVADEGAYRKGVNWLHTRDFFIGDVCVGQIGFFKAIFKGQFEVVIFWGDAWRISTWFGAILAKIRGRKVIFWTHGLYGRESKLKLKWRLVFYGIADQIFTYGNFARELLIVHGFDTAKVTAVSNSVSLVTKSRKDWSLGKPLNARLQNKINFCFIGRLKKGKSLKMLIDLVSHFKQHNSRYVGVRLVGDGPLRPELEKYAQSQGVSDRVIFHEAVYGLENLSHVLNDCVCCISPGNVGLTAITSLTLGLPVVTHSDPVYQMPEYESVVEGVSGRLFLRASFTDLVKKVELIWQDIAEEKITQSTCRNVVEEGFSEDSQISKIRSKLEISR